jgi:AraC-like DNA-binding protein
MRDRKVLEEVEGDVRFHHIIPELWVLEARRCARQWIVFHETYSFCLVLRIEDGALVPWKYNHRTYVADLDHAMTMQPGELHANVTRTPPADFMVVQVSASLMKRVAGKLGWPFSEVNVKHPHPGSDHPALLKALRRFHQSLCEGLFDAGPDGGRCTCSESIGRHKENLVGLVRVFIENCAENAREVGRPRQGAAQIARAASYLRAHYREPYSLERVARAAGCDPFYLAHVFTQEMGVCLSAFQNRILVAKVCEALAAAPDTPLDIIAREVGWPGRPGVAVEGEADKATLMIRHFRRAMGTTPGEFRASLREMSRAERRRYVSSSLMGVAVPGGVI